MILNRIQLQPLIAIFANVLQTNGHVNLRETSVSFFFALFLFVFAKSLAGFLFL